jgi:hypothetical protein
MRVLKQIPDQLNKYQPLKKGHAPSWCQTRGTEGGGIEETRQLMDTER